jgi:hypothetical protein
MYVLEIPRPICGMIPTQQPVRISASLMAYKYGQRSGMALKITKMAYCQISSSIHDIAKYISPFFLKTKTSAHCPPGVESGSENHVEKQRLEETKMPISKTIVSNARGAPFKKHFMRFSGHVFLS